jgi:hypothetical protein
VFVLLQIRSEDLVHVRFIVNDENPAHKHLDL